MTASEQDLARQSTAASGRRGIRSPVTNGTHDTFVLEPPDGVAASQHRDQFPGAAGPLAPASTQGRKDFGLIKIHEGLAAAVSATALRAHAYSVGSSIVLGGAATLADDGVLAHELRHQASGMRSASSIDRAVTPLYPRIEDKLSYGVFDWAVTDAEARAVLAILNGLSDLDLADTVAALDRNRLLDRLLDNIADEDRERYAVLIAKIIRRRSISRSANRVVDRLSYGLFDWAITDQDARDVFQVLLGLESQELRTVIGRMVNERVFDRFLDNLPRDDHRRFPAFIERIRDIRTEFASLVSAQVTFLRGRPGGAGRAVRERVESTGYGGSRSTWNDLSDTAKADWERRARRAIAAVRASARGTDLAPILDRSELVFEPEDAERLNAYAYVSGANRLFFGRLWVEDAERDVHNVWQSIAHELGGHEEFGDTWSWEIMRAAVARLSPEERRTALQSANSLFSAYGYLETEIYAELRELPHRIPTSGGDRPETDVPKELKRIHEAFGPVVGRQIALRLYYRTLDDPRVGASARRLLYSAIQAEFGLFPIPEVVLP
jgi:hypothetical protein